MNLRVQEFIKSFPVKDQIVNISSLAGQRLKSLLQLLSSGAKCESSHRQWVANDRSCSLMDPEFS